MENNSFLKFKYNLISHDTFSTSQNTFNLKYFFNNAAYLNKNQTKIDVSH